jgi:hypothetical protein
VDQTIRVVDLLVGGYAFRAELEPVDRMVARLDAEDATVGVDPQVHAALHAALRAVGRNEALSVLRCLPAARRDRAHVEEPVDTRGCGDDRPSAPGCHRNPPFRCSR